MGLKEMRKMAGYSQKELADETGINIKNIGFYENGNRDINGAKFATLLTICQALSCDLEDILTDEKIPIPSVQKNLNRGNRTCLYGIWHSKTVRDILKN